MIDLMMIFRIMEFFFRIRIFNHSFKLFYFESVQQNINKSRCHVDPTTMWIVEFFSGQIII